MIKINNTSAEKSFLFYEICILTCSNSFQYMLFGLFTVLQPQGGALSTYTYGEVSPIFLGQNIVKSDIFGSKEN